MKKKLKLLFTSHLHDRFGLIMRFCFLAGLLVTLQLSASGSIYATDSNSGANDVLAPQQVKITGTVTGSDGTPIPGVNIVITGTALGTATDAAGKYSIEVPRGSKSLRFSFIGMETQDINIGTLTHIDVTMVESGMGLNECG